MSRISTFQREVEAYLERHPHTWQVDLLLTDLNCSFRGKRVAFSSVRHLRRGFYFPAAVYAMTVTGKTVATAGLAGEDGEPDLMFLPRAGTFKPSAADPTHCAQLQLTMRDRDGQPYDVEPRNVLNRLWQQLRARGIFPVVAVELEFYLVDRRCVTGRRCRNRPANPKAGSQKISARFTPWTDWTTMAQSLTISPGWHAFRDCRQRARWRSPPRASSRLTLPIATRCYTPAIRCYS